MARLDLDHGGGTVAGYAKQIIMKIPRLSFGGTKKSFIRKTQHAPRDWIFALQLFLLVSIAGVGLSVYVFFTVNSQGDQNAGTPSSANASKSIIDEKALQDTIKMYDDKETTFDQYLKTLPPAPEI